MDGTRRKALLPSFTGYLDAVGYTRAADIAIKMKDKHHVQQALWDIEAVLGKNKQYKQHLKKYRNDLRAFLANADRQGVWAMTEFQAASASSSSADESEELRKPEQQMPNWAEADTSALSDNLRDSVHVATVPCWHGPPCHSGHDSTPPGCVHFLRQGTQSANSFTEAELSLSLLAAAKAGCGSCISELLKQRVSIQSTDKDGWSVWDVAHYFGCNSHDPAVLSYIEQAGGTATDLYNKQLQQQRLKASE